MTAAAPGASSSSSEASRSQPAARISGCGSQAIRRLATRRRTSCRAGSAHGNASVAAFPIDLERGARGDVHLDRDPVAGQRPGDRLHEHDARPALAARDDARRVRHVALGLRDDRAAAAALDAQPQRGRRG